MGSGSGVLYGVFSGSFSFSFFRLLEDLLSSVGVGSGFDGSGSDGSGSDSSGSDGSGYDGSGSVIGFSLYSAILSAKDFGLSSLDYGSSVVEGLGVTFAG